MTDLLEALDDEAFSPAAYNLPIPRMDDERATNLEIRFAGSGRLDRTSRDDLELLEAMRLRREVRLIVTGTISGKAYTVRGEDELAFGCTVRVSRVEAGEIA